MTNVTYLTKLLLVIAISAPLAAKADEARYNACSGLIEKSAKEALKTADDWLKQENSASAHHCRALALYKMGRFGEAAEELEKLANSETLESTARITAMKQAATSWQNARIYDRSALALEKAATIAYEIDDKESAAESLMQKAKLQRSQNNNLEAVQTLDQILENEPDNRDALLLRADTFDKLGKSSLAAKDREQVFGKTPAKPAKKTASKKSTKKKR